MLLAQQLQNTIVCEVPFRDRTIKLRIAPLDLWIKEGKVPTFFQEQYLRTSGGDKTVRKISPEEAEQYGREELAFREQVIRHCLVDPPVAPGGQEPKENELTMEQVQLIPGLYEFVYGFGIFRGNKAVLNTKGGGIKADDLATFRDESGQPDRAGAHGTEVLDAPVSTAGAAG
jgi:hypothetical protein